MKVFYRYIRPVRFDSRRGELLTHPKGGICLRFEELTANELWFTYSRCHDADLFNKEVAKRVADHRAEVARGDEQLVRSMAGIPNTNETTQLIGAVVSKCRMPADSHQIDWEAPLVEKYLRLERDGFSKALEKLVLSNEREERLAAAWSTAIRGTGIASLGGLK